MRYILGIDPSTSSTAYSILNTNGELIKYGTLKPRKTSKTLEQKMLDLTIQLRNVIDHFGKETTEITSIIEKPFNQFKHTEQVLMQLFGVLKVELARNKINIVEGHVKNINKVWSIPSKTKRKEKKQLTIDAVLDHFNIPKGQLNDDEADAISLALYQIQQVNPKLGISSIQVIEGLRKIKPLHSF